MKRSLLTAALCAVLAPPASAQAPLHIWSWGNPGAGFNTVSAIDEGADGTITIAGDFRGSLDLGVGLMTGLGEDDVFLAKLDSEGNAIWSRAFGGPFPDFAIDLALDSQGNAIVVGSFRSSVDFGGIVQNSAGLSDAYVAKFDSQGTLLWVHSYGATVFDAAAAVDVDVYDNILVTGNFEGDVDFGLGTINGAGLKDIFVLKLDPDGDALVTTSYGGSSHDSANDIEAFGLGDFVLCGFTSPGTDFGVGPITTAGGQDAFVAEYNENFFHQWSRVLGGSSSDAADALALDASGNVYVTGSFLDTADFGGGPLVSAGVSDIVLFKLDSMGVHQWSERFGSDDLDSARDLGCDLFGNTTMVGHVRGDVSFGGASFTHVDGDELFMAGFDANGQHRWSRIQGGVSQDQCRSVYMSLEGEVLVGGHFYEPQDLGGGIFSQYVGNMFLVKYRAPTVEPFILDVQDVGNDQGRAVRLELQRSTFDAPGSPAPIIAYEAYRRDDPLPGKMIGWDFVGSVPAHGDDSYSLVLPTLADSTLVDGTHWSVFMLRATTADPYTFIESAPDSSYSLDNLAPSVPQGLNLVGGWLSWEPAPESDFDYFTVYGSSQSVFDASAVAIAYRVEPLVDLSSESYGYFHVTSTDFAGNESGAASLLSATGVGDGPRGPSLAAKAYPNPFNPSTRIELRLPRDTRVVVAIYDGAGRRIRTLLDAFESAGVHSVDWNGVDNLGHPVASGSYFVRVRAAGQRLSEKVLLLK